MAGGWVCVFLLAAEQPAGPVKIASEHSFAVCVAPYGGGCIPDYRDSAESAGPLADDRLAGGADHHPDLSGRFGCYCVGIAVFAFAAWIASTENRGETGAQGSWPAIAAGCVLTLNALILIAVGGEIHSYWWVRSWTVDATKWQQYQMNAQFTYSAWFMVFGAALLAAGFWRRSAFLRWQALLLLAVTIGKVFLLDMSQLSQGFRILSFLGLGALLLAVSFVYQRDWLKLRAGSADHEA